MSGEVSELLKRLALAVLGQALPEASALDDIFRNTRKGLLFTIVTGVLISAGLLLACFGFYRFLAAQGLTMMAALVVSLGLLILMAVITTLVADRSFRRVEDARRRIGFFPVKKPSEFSNPRQDKTTLHGALDVAPEEVLAAFLEGFLSDGKGAARPAGNREDPADVAERATFTSFHRSEARH